MKRSRYNTFKPGPAREEPMPITGQKTAAGKRRARKAAGHSVGHSKTYAKYPLRPLRKRLGLSAKQIETRLDDKREKRGF